MFQKTKQSLCTLSSFVKIHHRLVALKHLMSCKKILLTSHVHMCGEIIAGHEDVLSFPDNLIQFHAREHPKGVDESQFSVNMAIQGNTNLILKTV